MSFPFGHGNNNVVPFPKKSKTEAERDAQCHAVDIQRAWVFLAAMLAAFASIGLSFVGTAYNLERDGGANFATLAAALSVSIVVGIFQIVGWSILLETRSYQSLWRQIAGALCAAAFLVFGYGTSSYFNYASITAPSATVIYLSDLIEERIAKLEALRIRNDAAKQLLPLVEAEERAGCSAAKLEQEKGIYSGSAGTGLVSGGLDGICQRSTEAADALRAAVTANENNAARADHLVDQLENTLSNVGIPILERERHVQSLVRDLDDVIRDTRSARMNDSIEAFFATLVTAVASLDSTGGTAFQASQSDALSSLRDGFEERLPIIKELIAKIDAVQVPEVTLDDQPSVHEVMRYSVWKHPQNVLLALGIDSFCAFFILVLLLKEPSKAKPRKRRK
ncbi:MAG: hypothetical protein AAFY02_14235 [Pseudomonadota bacterium]